MRTMKLVAYLSSAVLAHSASATILDQSQTTSSGSAAVYTGQSIAQIFTPGISGQLDSVVMGLHPYSGSNTLTASIVETTAGLPNATVLASHPVDFDDATWLSGFYEAPVSFLDDNISLTAGQQYAIVLEGTYSEAINAPNWNVLWGDGYAGGSGLKNTGTGWQTLNFSGSGESDTYFKTYMVSGTTVPEAGSTLALLGIALGGVASLKRRKM